MSRIPKLPWWHWVLYAASVVLFGFTVWRLATVEMTGEQYAQVFGAMGLVVCIVLGAILRRGRH
jgi:hypothetical protein